MDRNDRRKFRRQPRSTNARRVIDPVPDLKPNGARVDERVVEDQHVGPEPGLIAQQTLEPSDKIAPWGFMPRVRELHGVSLPRRTWWSVSAVHRVTVHLVHLTHWHHLAHWRRQRQLAAIVQRQCQGHVITRLQLLLQADQHHV